MIDLAEINLPFLDEPEMPARHRYRFEHTRSWSRLVSRYDGFVLVFPQCNWGYPAVLKNALDFLYDEWARKPLCIPCYGAHGGTKGAAAMGMVTEGLHTRNITSNPPIFTRDDMVDDAGGFAETDASFARCGDAMRAVAAELAGVLTPRGGAGDA